MSDELKKAIKYVRDNLKPYELARIDADIDEAYDLHLMPDNVCDYDKIIDLLEEYGKDNELAEGWWEEEAYINDILYEL